MLLYFLQYEFMSALQANMRRGKRGNEKIALSLKICIKRNC